jgi:hypothetical protein
MKNPEKFMKLNQDFNSYEGLDLDTDFHGRMENRW